MRKHMLLWILALLLTLAGGVAGYRILVPSQPLEEPAGAPPPAGASQVPAPKSPSAAVPSGGSYRKSENARVESWREKAAQFAKNYPGLVLDRGRTGEKVVSITFDDGPHPKYTPQILDILKQYRVPGAFFFIGESVKWFPEVAKRAGQEGHLILNHTWSHTNLAKAGPDEFKDQVTKAADEIYQVTGKRPGAIRPPYVGIDARVVGEARQQNEKIVLWSLDSFDWFEKGKEDIVRNVVDNVKPGDVILLHTIYRRSVEALPEIITQLRQKGYRMVPLAELLHEDLSSK